MPSQVVASDTGQPGLVQSVALEFAKARRKHLWLASLGLLAFQFAWLVRAPPTPCATTLTSTASSTCCRS